MNCTWRKTLSTHKGFAFKNVQDTNRISSRARMKPVNGDSTMAAAVLLRPDQTITFQPPLHSPAPTNPPIKAWDEEEGMPASQVTTFHTIAPISAPKIT